MGGSVRPLLLLVCLFPISCPGSGADTAAHDPDGDGFIAPEDCDETNPWVHPGAEDRWYDGVDQDCDGRDDFDQDGDGHPVSEDCDDADPLVHPDAREICDGRDNDCDRLVDGPDAEGARPWFPDLDGDGWGAGSKPTLSCVPSEAFSARGGDCDDANPEVHPGAEERFDGIDQDCDGRVDEGGPPRGRAP
jgi:hypothetical protein